MRNVILLAVLLFAGKIGVLAQASDSKVHKEKDGFEWLEISDGIAPAVAKHMDGRIIVTPKLKSNYVRYDIAEDGPFSIGYFRLTQYTKDYKMREAICDIKGNIIIPFKYESVSMRVKVLDTDTLAYICTSDDNLKTINIFTLDGEKIASKINTFDVDDCGNFIDWNTKKNLGIRMPKVNGQLSNFNLKQSGKNVKTSLGLYEVQEKETNGFKWHLLYTSSLCGAQTVDGKVIVPVERKCKEIKYDNGVFIGKTIDDVYCAYSKGGEEIIPISYNYCHIAVDVYTKTFIKCVIKNNGESHEGLHDLNGKLIFPARVYSSITPKKVNNKIYFIVSRDGKNQVLDHNHNHLMSVDEPCFVSDIYEDKLGIYYEILHRDINRNVGIIDDKGKVVISPGRYDLIKRIVNEKVACYETTIIIGDKYSNRDPLYGICDLEGNEVLPNEYNVCYYSDTEILEMEKDGMRYKINIVQLITEVKAQRDRQLAYAQDLAEREYVNHGQNSQNSQQQINTSSSSLNDTGSKYTKLSNPNLVDNSEKIANAHQLISELELQKQNCSFCHGIGSIPQVCTMCHGTGTRKIGYMTPQYFVCTWCQGTGKQSKQCLSCAQTDVKISITRNLLKTLQETHGMTKEVLKTYTDIKAWEHNQNMEHQRAIDAIAEPYLNSTRKSNSSHSSTSSSSKCSLCNGTGIDPSAYELTYVIGRGLVVGYTNQSGTECPYCKKISGHKHVYCPKCKADKHR